MKEPFFSFCKIVKIKSDTMYRTVDQVIFDIMENKYNISQEIINVIKEASIDCIQNSRDNIILNENCIRFDKSIQDEDAFFPGINDSNLNSIDECINIFISRVSLGSIYLMKNTL